MPLHDSNVARTEQLLIHPFQQRLTLFRNEHGYGGPLYTRGEATHGPFPLAAPAAKRIDEIVHLLNASACPRPSGQLEAYILAFHLIQAVDGKYFGPFDPAVPVGARLGLPGIRIIATSTPGGLGMLLRDWMLVFGASGGLEVWQLRSGHLRLFPRAPAAADATGLSPSPVGGIADLQRYIGAVAVGAHTSAPATKRQRMNCFLDLLQHAPPPANVLVALATVNGLLSALETAAGVGPGERMYGVLPFTVWTAPAFPQAAILLSIAHALFYYPDGTVEIYDQKRDFSRSAPGMCTLELGRHRATLAGKREKIAQPTALQQ